MCSVSTNEKFSETFYNSLSSGIRHIKTAFNIEDCIESTKISNIQPLLDIWKIGRGGSSITIWIANKEDFNNYYNCNSIDTFNNMMDKHFKIEEDNSDKVRGFEKKDKDIEFYSFIPNLFKLFARRKWNNFECIDSNECIQNLFTLNEECVFNSSNYCDTSGVKINKKYKDILEKYPEKSMFNFLIPFSIKRNNKNKKIYTPSDSLYLNNLKFIYHDGNSIIVTGENQHNYICIMEYSG